jgi:hypothetical protein
LHDGEESACKGDGGNVLPLQAQQNITVRVLRRVVHCIEGDVRQHAQLLRARRDALETGIRVRRGRSGEHSLAERGGLRACFVTRSTARSFTLSGAERHLTL